MSDATVNRALFSGRKSERSRMRKVETTFYNYVAVAIVSTISPRKLDKKCITILILENGIVSGAINLRKKIREFVYAERTRSVGAKNVWREEADYRD